MRLSDRAVRFGLKPIVFVAALGPAAWLLWAALTDHLSANPLSDITNETGVWTLRFLCITLAVTPLRRVTGWNAAIKFRRMTGLFAFFYGSLHFLTYVIVDRFAGLDFPDGIVSLDHRAQPRGVGRRGHLQAAVHHGRLRRADADGAAGGDVNGRDDSAAWAARWQTLHRLVYVSGALGVIHYWWLVKADVSSPLRYARRSSRPCSLLRLFWRRKKRDGSLCFAPRAGRLEHGPDLSALFGSRRIASASARGDPGAHLRQIDVAAAQDHADARAARRRSPPSSAAAAASAPVGSTTSFSRSHR